MKILRLLGVILLALIMVSAVTFSVASGSDPPMFAYLTSNKIGEEQQVGGRRSGSMPGGAVDEHELARQGGLTRRSRRGLRNWFLSHDSFGLGNITAAHKYDAALNRYGSGVLTRATGMVAA